MLTHSYCEYETFHTHECHSLFRKVLILAVIFLIYGETFFIQFMFYKSLNEGSWHSSETLLVSYHWSWLYNMYFENYVLLFLAGKSKLFSSLRGRHERHSTHLENLTTDRKPKSPTKISPRKLCLDSLFYLFLFLFIDTRPVIYDGFQNARGQ
mgnify:CR=1 FL=1